MTIQPTIVPNTEELVQGTAQLIIHTADPDDREAVKAYGQQLTTGERITGTMMRAFIPAFYRAVRLTRYQDLTLHLTDAQRSQLEDAIALAVYQKSQRTEAA